MYLNVNWGRDPAGTRYEPDNAENQDPEAMVLTGWPVNPGVPGQGGLGQVTQRNDLIAMDALIHIVERGR